MKFRHGIFKNSEHTADEEAHKSHQSHNVLAPENHSQDDRQDLLSNEVKYKCPMGCEDDKTYDSPGNCPVCNMKLAPVRTLINEPVEYKIVK